MIIILQRKTLILCLSLLISVGAFANIPFTHEQWNAVLGKYVDKNGFVDYQGLNNDRDQFDRYVYAIKRTGPKLNPKLFPDKDHQLAYYINAYNALVFEGVLNRGPEEKSVWRGFVSGLNFFIRMKVMIDGEQTNLKKLEDDVIREQFKDPRIHAALNCASISCPRLPQHAFEADQLDQQLDAAIIEFVNDKRHVQVDEQSQKVYLSKIFDWFEDDFIDYERTQGSANPTVIGYINRYRKDTEQLPTDYDVDILKYNKDINKQS